MNELRKSDRTFFVMVFGGESIRQKFSTDENLSATHGRTDAEYAS